MKALFFISIIFFSPFLLLNTPAFGQAESVLSVAQLEDLKNETLETVKLTRFQLHRSYDKDVVGSRRRRINVASRGLKNAMTNDAVAGDLLKEIRETRRVNSTRVSNCKKISSELRVAMKYLASGKLNKARDSVIAVEEIAKTQPEPVRLEAVLRNFDRVVSEESGLFEAKTKMTKDVNKIKSAQAQAAASKKKKELIGVAAGCGKEPKPPKRVEAPVGPPQEPISPISPEDLRLFAEKMSKFLNERRAYEKYQLDLQIYEVLMLEWLQCQMKKRPKAEILNPRRS